MELIENMDIIDKTIMDKSVKQDLLELIEGKTPYSIKLNTFVPIKNLWKISERLKLKI